LQELRLRLLLFELQPALEVRFKLRRNISFDLAPERRLLRGVGGALGGAHFLVFQSACGFVLSELGRGVDGVDLEHS